MTIRNIVAITVVTASALFWVMTMQANAGGCRTTCTTYGNQQVCNTHCW